MKYLYLETFKDFKCIGSECPLTCCGAGWKIAIDPDSYDYYMSVDGEFGEKLKNSISTTDGVNEFILTDKGNCPFLNEKKLCDIYNHLGEEHLCYTCTIYPRYYFNSGDIMFSGVSISCPVVARFLLSCKEKLQVDFSEDDSDFKIGTQVDWDTFNRSVHVFTTSIGIIQNRNYSVRERLAILTLFLSQYQSHVDEKRNATGLINLFDDESNYDKFLPETGIYQKNLKAKLDYCIELLTYFRGIDSFETYVPEFADLAKHYYTDTCTMSTEKLLFAFSTFDNDEEQIWQEQLLTYSLFRYFMQGFEKGDYYDQYMIGLLFVYWFYIIVIVLYYHQWDRMPDFDEKVLMIAHISRLVEHSSNFKEEALEHFRAAGMTDPFFVLKFIS